jgi:hypothetical protein
MYRRILIALMIFLFAAVGAGQAQISALKITAQKHATKSPKGMCAYTVSYPRLSGLHVAGKDER